MAPNRDFFSPYDDDFWGNRRFRPRMAQDPEGPPVAGPSAPPPPSAPAPPPEAPPEPFNYTPPPYQGPSRPQFNFGAIPEFDAPDFAAPTWESIANDPGYQFRSREGRRALEASKLAQGTGRTGGTLKELMAYGQGLASQEYANAYDRALQAYDRQYRGAYDEYAPRLAEWQFRSGADRDAAMAAFQLAWDRYRFGQDDEFRREQMILDALARAGY